MRPRPLDVWKPGFERDVSQFAREMGRFGGEMARFGRDFGRMQRRGRGFSPGRRSHRFHANGWGAGPWVADPWPLGLGLCGLRRTAPWNRRRALRYRSYYRRRRFWRTLQILLGVALVAIVIAIMSRQDEGSTNSNWL